MKNLYSLTERVEMRTYILNRVQEDALQFELNDDTLDMFYIVMTHAPVSHWRSELTQICEDYAHEMDSHLRRYNL